MRKRNDGVPVFMVVALLCTSFVLVGTSVVNVRIGPTAQPAGPTDLNMAAYNAAKDYIRRSHPGVQNLSEYFQSGVEHTGNVFNVTLATDEEGADKHPVRNSYRVEMEFIDGKWVFKSVKQ